MNKHIIAIIILAVVIAVLGAVLLWPETNQPNGNLVPKEGLTVTTPKPNDVISSPLKITGLVNGGGWIGFEGQVGVVKLFDENNNELGLALLTAKGEWMQTNIDFETMLWFDYPGDGQGKLVFYNENPSGEVERNRTYEMPVKLTKSSSAKTVVKAYFMNNELDPEVSCSEVFPVTRELPKTEAVARVAVEELLKGPTDMETFAGFSTSINSGVSIKSLVIESGVAKVDFSQKLQEGVAGSCNVTAIRAQIEQTLKQFPTVKSVVISIDGNTEDILQP